MQFSLRILSLIFSSLLHAVDALFSSDPLADFRRLFFGKFHFATLLEKVTLLPLNWHRENFSEHDCN